MDRKPLIESGVLFGSSIITKEPPLLAYSLRIGSSMGRSSEIAPGITTTAGSSAGSSNESLCPSSWIVSL